LFPVDVVHQHHRGDVSAYRASEERNPVLDIDDDVRGAEGGRPQIPHRLQMDSEFGAAADESNTVDEFQRGGIGVAGAEDGDVVARRGERRRDVLDIDLRAATLGLRVSRQKDAHRSFPTPNFRVVRLT
jgi:hypothetical protein